MDYTVAGLEKVIKEKDETINKLNELIKKMRCCVTCDHNARWEYGVSCKSCVDYSSYKLSDTRK
jgi:hypothetical protein